MINTLLIALIKRLFCTTFSMLISVKKLINGNEKCYYTRITPLLNL